ALGRARASTAVTFVSAAALAGDVPRRLGLARKAVAVGGCRRIGKRDMVHNSAVPRIDVDAETYEVRADGDLRTCEPARVLPMAQRYFLFKGGPPKCPPIPPRLRLDRARGSIALATPKWRPIPSRVRLDRARGSIVLATPRPSSRRPTFMSKR